MSTKQVLLYCVVCLGFTLGAITLLFERAALTPQQLALADTPKAMEAFRPINLGMPYGKVSMTDLVGYYLEHPPKAAATGRVADPSIHIGGC